MMTRTASTLAALVCFVPLAACANMEGDWPSLKTPAEQRTGTCDNLEVAMAEPQAVTAQPGPSAQPATGAAGGGAASGVAAPDVAAIATRLAEERRDFETALDNWQRQRTATESAAGAARNAAPASEAWATSELELTRFNQAAARFEQIRDAVNRMTGELAMLAASGTDVSAPLREAGQLLRRIEQAAAAHQAAIAPLQATQPR